MKVLYRVVVLLLLLSPLASFSAIASEISDEQLEAEFAGTKKKLIKLSHQGFTPRDISLDKSKEETSIFFLNVTADELLSIEVDFSAKTKHCWSKNLEVTDEGILRTVKPVGPTDFAVLCFPEKGTYPVTIKGLSKYPEGLKGRVIVR